MTHKITCATCKANKFVEIVPDIFICDHLNAQDHPGMRWYVCPQCIEGSWIEGITHIPKCSICEKRNSVKDLGMIITNDKNTTFNNAGNQLLTRKSPGDLIDFKSEAEKQTELLETIVLLLKKEKT